ncbi:ASCH domain protein [Botrimarina hoheduenensis]|uniref:ASCH domain protein n=2 Tax=Botrimarina hoheduenensis TaxID=2528000 RepID=A0A5C5VXX5_9BACT|nr:ASCH domain protein [Botrimarina hoheduenensis]
MLLFKRKFLEAIRAGEKTQTIRLWKHRMMRTGQRSYIPGVGPIRITLVNSVELENLTDEDARPDGFDTADALRAELHTIYGDKLAAGYQTFRVVFERQPSPEPPETSQAPESPAES